jgi:hypothetical protein
MALSDLTARLRDPRLQDFVACWHQARGDRLVPRWRDLDVGLMRQLLPYAWAWGYDRASDVFTGKLAGEQILAVLGRGFRGAKAHEFFTPSQRVLVLAQHRKVVLDQVGMVTTGLVFSHADSDATGQRVILPVATRSEHEADTIFGVTLYAFNEGPVRDIRAEVPATPVEFFTLEGGPTPGAGT